MMSWEVGSSFFSDSYETDTDQEFLRLTEKRLNSEFVPSFSLESFDYLIFPSTCLLIFFFQKAIWTVGKDYVLLVFPDYL